MWSSKKRERYAKAESTGGFEELSKKLTDELQAKMYLLKSAEVMSDEWLAMAEFCGRVAKISEVERTLSKTSGTMREGEEVALRFLMEEGKLNLCLRLLVDCRDYVKRNGETPETVNFEKGMGLLLKNAWHHAEALQTTDLPLFCSYVASVLGQAPPKAISNGRQEIQVLHYLKGLSSHLESLSLLNFMTLLKNAKILEHLVLFLDTHHGQLPRSDLLAAAQALSTFVDADDFHTYEHDHISKNAADKVKNFKINFIDDLLSQEDKGDNNNNFDLRATLSPLLRYVQDCHYSN